jgi:hypothetical protein
MVLVAHHPEKDIIRAQLKQNLVLKLMTADEMMELESYLVVVDCQKGDCLLHQGDLEMEQYFILDGILKRVVANKQGKQMILRFADEKNMERAMPHGGLRPQRRTASWRSPKPALRSCRFRSGLHSWSATQISSRRSSTKSCTT